MINILYAGNYKVFDGILISILSVIKHTKQELNVRCLTMNLSEVNKHFLPLNNEQEKYLDILVKEINPKSSFKLIDVTNLFKQELGNTVNIDNHFTPYAMLRLLADLVDDMPDKIIYLDADTIINNDIEQLYNFDLQEKEIGGVKDIYLFRKKYFNSGVLLIDLKKIKQNKTFFNARKIVLSKKMKLVDQTALNIASKDKLMLPLKFNAQNKYFPEIVVHHFCNVRMHWFYRIKPWEIALVKKVVPYYNDILDDYLNRKKITDLFNLKVN